MLRRWPLHPLFFAAFPVLFLFVENIHLVRPGKLVFPLLEVIGTTAVLCALGTLVLRDVRRAAIIASGLVLLALSYGHLWSAVQGKSVVGFVVGRDLVLLPLWGLLAVGVVAFAWRLRATGEMTTILNGVGAILLVLTLINGGQAVPNQRTKPRGGRAGSDSLPFKIAASKTEQRDVFYIIIEDYGGADVNKKDYGVDVTPFYAALRQRGFYVADKATTNYPHTAYSLASSLNMTYLDSLARNPGPDSADWGPLYRMLLGPRIAQFLQSEGYRYVHIGSWWDPEAQDPKAQVNYLYDRRSEFSRVFLQTTLVRPLAKHFGFLKGLDSHQYAHNQILFQLDSLVDAEKLPGPSYVFAQIMMPHLPFTFDANLNFVDQDRSDATPDDERYAQQVQAVNKLILRVVDKLLAVPPQRRPIIVIQSDEGPNKHWDYGHNVPWSAATDADLKHKFPILSTYYLPGVKDTGLYPSITPVNTFRKILNLYFGTKLPALPDQNYGYGTDKSLYRFTNLTSRVR